MRHSIEESPTFASALNKESILRRRQPYETHEIGKRAGPRSGLPVDSALPAVRRRRRRSYADLPQVSVTLNFGGDSPASRSIEARQLAKLRATQTSAGADQRERL